MQEMEKNALVQNTVPGDDVRLVIDKMRKEQETARAIREWKKAC